MFEKICLAIVSAQIDLKLHCVANFLNYAFSIAVGWPRIQIVLALYVQISMIKNLDLCLKLVQANVCLAH